MFSSAPSICGLVRAGKCSPGTLSLADSQTLGWESPTYGELRPAVSVVCNTRAALPLRLVTVVLMGDEVCLQRTGEVLSFWRGNSSLYQVNLAALT
jgi:hypothetical protein